MAEEKKPWWKSKTIWAGIVAVAISAYNSAAVQFGLPAIPDFVFALLGAFGIYSRTVASGTITK